MQGSPSIAMWRALACTCKNYREIPAYIHKSYFLHQFPGLSLQVGTDEEDKHVTSASCALHT
eukprot:1157286-Pelagomonas_calceolata.AAC.5